MKDLHWHIEPGRLLHRAAPGLSARWTTGAQALADIDGFCWTDAGAEDDDVIHLYGFAWAGPVPRQDEFERLMREAVVAIDRWIAARA